MGSVGPVPPCTTPSPPLRSHRGSGRTGGRGPRNSSWVSSPLPVDGQDESTRDTGAGLTTREGDTVQTLRTRRPEKVSLPTKERGFWMSEQRPTRLGREGTVEGPAAPGCRGRDRRHRDYPSGSLEPSSLARKEGPRYQGVRDYSVRQGSQRTVRIRTSV